MNLHDLLTMELAKLPRPLRVVETGSIRNDDISRRDDDGWSTLWFAQQENVSLHSIDLDVSAAGRVLERNGGPRGVTLVQGHSILGLATLIGSFGAGSFDVAFLDSSNDPELILHEFLTALVLVRNGGMILIDDVAIETKPYTGGTQGSSVIEHCRLNQLPYRLCERN